MHPSIKAMIEKYFASIGEQPVKLDVWYFCDNEQDANECAELALKGIKRATTSSLAWFEQKDMALPEVGDLNVVTDWSGRAVCIIQTRQVEIVPFNQVTPAYAEIEGEGDKSLEYWRRVHWAYYHRELSEFGMVPVEDMPVVCEIFEVVYPCESLSL